MYVKPSLEVMMQHNCMDKAHLQNLEHGDVNACVSSLEIAGVVL